MKNLKIFVKKKTKTETYYIFNLNVFPKLKTFLKNNINARILNELKMK